MDCGYQMINDQDDDWYESPRYHTVPNGQDFAKTGSLFNLDNLDDDDSVNTHWEIDMNRYLNVNKFIVEYELFPLIVRKKQVRCKGKPNQQRLNQVEAAIKLHLVFEENVEFKDVFKVYLKVRRANAVPNYLKKYAGFVSLDPVEAFQQEGCLRNKVAVYANLDNLIESDYVHNIYDLSKNDPKHNEFNLLIEVALHDGSISNFTTRSFTVVGQKAGDKRKTSPDSPDSSMSSKTKVFENPSENKDFAHHQRIVYELIEAKQGIFNNLKANVIKTGNGDIAYHFVLKDQRAGQDYIPGEIVGFTTSEDGKEVMIDKLSPSNAKTAFLKGVVTQSQYIEAHFPEDTNVITATICMLGVVPVRVMGPVRPGEALVASKVLPGTAISKKLSESRKTDTVIGYAFEGKEDCDKDEIEDVQALVSIISGAGHLLVEKQLSRLEKSLKTSIHFNIKRSRKCFTALTLTMVFLGILLGFLIYQVKGTGTLYQKWKCKQGSVGKCRYWYWLQGGEYVGYQFKTCEVAWQKAISKRRFFARPHLGGGSQPICINGTTTSGETVKYNYYINQASCAGVIWPGARYLFATDEHCRYLYKFDEVLGKWDKDPKICFEERCNIICNDRKRKCTPRGWKRCPA